MCVQGVPGASGLSARVAQTAIVRCSLFARATYVPGRVETGEPAIFWAEPVRDRVYFTEVETDGLLASYGPGHREEGERLAVVGRSGCGKSTLLALLAGVRRPSSGGVLYRGESTIPLGREVLWVPQEVRPFGGTVRENLALMLGGVGTDDLVDRLWASALGEVLVPLLEVPTAALSIPEGRLLVYAGAALRRLDVLLLDEPTSGMGDVEREVLIRSLRALGRGSTVVLVTHSPSLAAACDRVVSLREGVVEKLPH